MPKRILPLAFALVAISLAACNSGLDYNSLYGTPAPTSTATGTPDPTVTAAAVTVTVSGSPLPNQQVVLANDTNGVPGSTIATQLTDATGQTTFTALTGAANYCFSTTYTPPAPGLQQTKSYCGNRWQYGIILQF